MKNEKAIIQEVLQTHPHLNEVEVTEFVRDLFAAIVTTCWEGDKVILKNIGTFCLKNKKQRKRYDQGLKQVVETPPMKTIRFIQSPNVFRNEST